MTRTIFRGTNEAMRILIAIIAVCTVALAALTVSRRPTQGCSRYTPADGPLMAHAGGGLPSRFYANNRAALDLAARHGFKFIELDFMERDGRFIIGHDGMPESDMTPADLMLWMDAHPRISIVTDFKTDNLNGLARLRAIAGPRVDRLIPQIYSPAEYSAVRRLGYGAPILTVYRIGDDGWQEAANALPLRAVTIPYERRHLSKGVKHPVFLHTVNKPVAGYGLYTDCLIPKGAAR